LHGNAETPSEKGKKSNNGISSPDYDDETIETMIRYYKLEENHDSFLKYLKSRGVQR